MSAIFPGLDSIIAVASKSVCPAFVGPSATEISNSETPGVLSVAKMLPNESSDTVAPFAAELSNETFMAAIRSPSVVVASTEKAAGLGAVPSGFVPRIRIWSPMT